MDALKKFFKDNKKLAIITSSSTLIMFVVFTIIAVAISGGPASATGNNNNEEATTKKYAEIDTNISTEETVSQEVGEETTLEEGATTESTSPSEPVDSNSLPYLIKVNRAANCLTVYAKDDDGNYVVPIKAIVVSCGKNYGDTPSGTYYTVTGNDYDWRKMVDGTYAQNAYRFNGPILFHSVPYFSANKNDLEWKEFNKLGTPASLGCVRMNVADSKWLRNNCPYGTCVIVYDDAANPGPLGKPDTIKIPEDSPNRGWDPSDPDPRNPWKNYSASITYPASKIITVPVGATAEDIISNFSATDTCGNDISHKIRIRGKYDTNAAGTFEQIRISVTDAIGSYAEVYVTLKVVNKTNVVEPSTEKPTQATTESTTAPTETVTEATTENTTVPTEVSTEDTTAPTEPSTDDVEPTNTSEYPTNPSDEETTLSSNN